MILRRVHTALLTCALCMSYARSAPAQVAPGRIAFEPYSLRTYDGQLHDIELGKLTVPESRAKPAGPTVTVAFLRLKSTSPNLGSPIVFLMGGASSLLVEPTGGITLRDKQSATAALLKSGMPIRETNCVRKHISGIKAGGLLRAAYPARVLTLAISDVIGDDPTVIGSAPSFHDFTTFRDAWTILEKHSLTNKIPSTVRKHLLRGARGEIPETLKPGSVLSSRTPFVVIANNKDALAAAEEKAESLGFAVKVLTAKLSGDAQSKARGVCRKLKSTLRDKKSRRRPLCFLLGGETTVSVKGKGLGGRNQEFALASALELSECRGISLLSAASDGSDGPTDAAGAFVDGETFARARELGIDPYRALRDNDSYHFFEPLGDLFSPGPTGTNVLDFSIALVYRDDARGGS